jgi:class 3 adenylate cyclase
MPGLTASETEKAVVGPACPTSETFSEGDEIGRYLPVMVRHALAAGWARQSGLQFTSIEAAVLLIDVSSYTSLTRRALSAGADILERFNGALNDFFCQAIDLLYGEGGDVVTFEGDAILALFPVGRASLADVVARAARCALTASRLHLDIADLPLGTDLEGGSCRVTVGCGKVWLTAFGRPGRRRHVLAAGQALDQLTANQGHALPGSVVVTPEVAGFLETKATYFAEDDVRTTTRTLASLSGHESSALLPPLVSGVATADLLEYFPAAISERIALRQSEWLAEIRFVCPLFVSLTPAHDSSPVAECIAETVLRIEDVLIRFGGELLQVRANDSSMVAVGIFGTPGATHEDDALRAALAGCELRNVVDPAIFRLAVGVSSGTALCGVYGNLRRQDYGVIGDVMNCAARLMQRKDGVLSDKATAQLAGRTLAWSNAGSVVLKGFAQPLEVARLEGLRRQVAADAAPAPASSQLRLIGRAHEQARIDASLSAHVAGRSSEEGRILLIEAEAGMGKSVLARFALGRAQDMALPALLVPASHIERFTAYYVWRTLLQRVLIADESTPGPARLTKAILDLLACTPNLLEFAPLLRDILPVEIEATELTRQMEPSARATMTARLLVHLLEKGGAGPLLIVFEDAHWIDSASWSVIILAARRASQVLIVLTMRTEFSAAFTPETTDFLQRHRERGIQLQGLSDSETGAVVSARLGARQVASDVSRFLREQSAGNPFFAEELALMLRERGQFGVDAEGCITATALPRPESIDLPNTVRATILERIDRLSAQQQLLLKIASVIGTVSPMNVLSEIFATQARADSLGSDLEHIQARHLADLEQQDGEAVLCFRHAITQESAYSMLPPSQKRALHRSVALWYERACADRPEPWLPLLAHHFREASEKPKALFYLGRAGEQALQAHANAEAVQFLNLAIALERELAAPPTDCAQRRRMLAEAHLKLSELARCREHLLEALALLGQPLPDGNVRVIVDLARALLRTQIAKPSPMGSSLLTAQLHQLRAEVAYFEHDTLALLHGTFAGLRDALRCPPSRELASAHGTAAIVFGLLGLHRLSQRHAKAAIEVAAASGNAPTAAYVQHLKCVCASAIGDWDEAERTVKLAAEGYRRVGDQYRWQTTYMILAYQALHRGQFNQIEAYLAEADEHSIFPGGPLQLRTWFRTVQLARANAGAMTGADLPPAALIREVQALGDTGDPSQALLCRGFAADALLLSRQLVRAREQADLGLDILQQHLPTTYFSLFGIVSIVSTFISLAELGGGNSRELHERGRFALARLRRFGVMVPIAAPCVLLQQGRMCLLKGDATGASRRLSRARRRAAELDMKGVEAAACRVLDRPDGRPIDDRGYLAWA